METKLTKRTIILFLNCSTLIQNDCAYFTFTDTYLCGFIFAVWYLKFVGEIQSEYRFQMYKSKTLLKITSHNALLRSPILWLLLSTRCLKTTSWDRHGSSYDFHSFTINFHIFLNKHAWNIFHSFYKENDLIHYNQFSFNDSDVCELPKSSFSSAYPGQVKQIRDLKIHRIKMNLLKWT